MKTPITRRAPTSNQIEAASRPTPNYSAMLKWRSIGTRVVTVAGESKLFKRLTMSF